MKLYVDANIYLDLFLNRKGKYTDFAQEANTIFRRAKSCEFEIIISDVVAVEVTKRVSVDSIKELRSFLGIKVHSVRKASMDELCARSFHTHRADALHIVLAERYADCIITRNIGDFKESTIPVFLPESF
jgi:predicted nucleic acid-binding protein